MSDEVIKNLKEELRNVNTRAETILRVLRSTNKTLDELMARVYELENKEGL